MRVQFVFLLFIMTFVCRVDGDEMRSSAVSSESTVLNEKAESSTLSSQVYAENTYDGSYVAAPYDDMPVDRRTKNHIHMSGFLNSTSHSWGSDGRAEDMGRFNFGLTHFRGPSEWIGDVAIRTEFTTYRVGERQPVKLAALPMLFYPEWTDEFPIYFGLGVGLGIMFNAPKNESAFTFEYQVSLGLKFDKLFSSYEGWGFFLEGGIKNHLSLLSKGEFDGEYIAAGVSFQL